MGVQRDEREAALRIDPNLRCMVCGASARTCLTQNHHAKLRFRERRILSPFAARRVIRNACHESVDKAPPTA